MASLRVISRKLTDGQERVHLRSLAYTASEIIEGAKAAVLPHAVGVGRAD
jgi:hypothetical protein